VTRISPVFPTASDFGAAVIAATAVLTPTATGTAPAGAARFEGIGGGTATPGSTAATAVAAVFPAFGTGAPIATAAVAATAITSPAAITAATTTTVAAAAPARGATTTAATATAGFGLVDAQGTAHQLGALEGVDRPGLGVGVGHLDKGEAALAAGVTLQGQRAIDHVSEGSEQLSHVLLLSAEGKIADENTH
jgi:hypothetical protein